MTGSPKLNPEERNSRELEELLRITTDILRRFAGLLDRDIDRGIDDTLAAIGSHVEVDRCYVFLVNEEEDTVSNTHEWCADDIRPEKENLQDVPFGTIGWWKPRLESDETIYIPRAPDLPDTRRAERDILVAQSIQSLLVVPLIARDRLRGFLGFDSVKNERQWSTEAQLLLRAVADVFVGAMARQDTLAVLLAKERHFAALVEHSTDVLMVLDRQKRFSYLSPTAARLLGLPEESGLGRSLLDCCHPSDRNPVGSVLSATRSGSIQSLPDFRIKHRTGRWTWLMGTARDLTDDPAVKGIVVNAQEIDARKQAEKTLQIQATHDALTGLPNRTLLSELLDQAIGRCRRHGERLAVLFIDLDQFKLINDGQGHRVGDALLVDVAQRLLRITRREDSVARFGGDEFVAILSAPKSEDTALATAAERLLSIFDETFNVAGVDRLITASAGLAISSGLDTAEEIIGNADAAMYLAKESGRACLRIFDETLRDQLMERIELEGDLAGATHRKELHLHYQPIVDTTSHVLLGFETLLRWQHPERGLVMPDRFIATAEQSGLIVEFGAWVLEEATAQLSHWLESYPNEQIYLSMNLSPVQLRDPDFPDLVRSALSRHNLSPHHICLEVTETALMEHRERSISTLEQLRDLGVQLAIDDFGTGHSSLAYLRDLPVHQLKIDKSFVQQMQRTTADYSIVSAIQVLASEYGLKTVAEGVETESQENMLRELGCDMLQGYRFGKPKAADQAESVIRKGRSDPASISPTPPPLE